VNARGWLAERRRSATVVVLVLLLLVGVSVLTVSSAAHGGDLDPDNAAPEGARAVARVLADHGVDVTVVRRQAALEHTELGRGTTLLVTATDQLGRSTARALAGVAATAGSVVLADPGPAALQAFRLPLVPVRAHVADRTSAGCGDDLLSGLAVDAGDYGYRSRGRARGVVGCFRTAAAEPGHTVALVARVDRAVPTYAVAAADLLSNARVARADNAAAALRLLGQGDRLVWYVPDSRDVPVGDAGSVSAQLPRGLGPGLWLVLAAVLATMLWRARRLGPLVVEPLPVVVKAIESTRGRGRLYRRVRDRAHTAAVLRAAASRRLAARLGLPATTPVGALVVPVAAATGRDPAAVADLLVTRGVTDDAALSRLADDLTTLEREAHRP